MRVESLLITGGDERMPTEVGRVPVALLLDDRLTPSAKLIWMVCTLLPPTDRAGTTWLCQTTGLSRPAVLKNIARLVAAGWNPPCFVDGDSTGTALVASLATSSPPPNKRRPRAVANQAGPTVTMPHSLLTDRRLRPSAQVLFGILELVPGYRYPHGEFRYEEMSRLAHMSRNTIAQALSDLAWVEWIEVERAHRLDQIYFAIRFPGYTKGMNALTEAQDRLAAASYHGEAIMREYLSLLIDSDHYEDDANPGFLVNPRTDQRLQLDRYYPPDVAFEFNGPQHYRPTDMFSAEQVKQQMERDYVKVGICAIRGVKLVIVHPQDLSLRAMQAKVGGLLPLRDLTGYDLFIDFLQEQSVGYARKWHVEPLR